MAYSNGPRGKPSKPKNQGTSDKSSAMAPISSSYSHDTFKAPKAINKCDPINLESGTSSNGAKIVNSCPPRC